MTPILGIDLGTTNSLIGIMDAGFPILLADAKGERLTPSVVHFPADGTPPIVGRAAARLRAIDPTRTVASIKRLMGRRRGEEPDDLGVTLIGGSSEPVRVKVGEHAWLPEEVAALILKKLRADAERALGESVNRAVITVPAYFNDAQRQATKIAGEMAGFTVERIVNEPTAAALAYGLEKLRDRAKIAVFDFGGGTFDISILELNQGVFQVLSTAGHTRLGGDDIDAALLARCTLPLPIWKKRDLVIAAKHRLSTESEVELPLPFLDGADGKNALAHLTYRLTRAELEAVAQPILQRTWPLCRQALSDAQIRASDLDEVILVGGPTRMPVLRALVHEIFGRAPHTLQNPDEAVALGATVQAGILSGAVQNMVLLDVTPLSLGIETFGGLMNVIIPRNSTIPTKAGELFTNAVAGQTGMQIKVLQGERERARDNWTLGEFTLEFPPLPKSQARVGVQFEIDANGILQVLARDTHTGAEKKVDLASAVDVSDEAVELMIADSLEHAFEDLSDRIFTEARLKAEEMIPAVRGALQSVGERLPSEDFGAIVTLITEVENAIRAGEAPRLQRANTALDEGTQTLATLLLEKALQTPPG